MLTPLLTFFFLQGTSFCDGNQLPLQILKAVVPICRAKIVQGHLAMRTFESLGCAVELVGAGR